MEEQSGDQVRLINGVSSFSPKGIISPLLKKKDIGSEETIEFSLHLAKQGKFLDRLTKLNFDELREGGTEESGPYWTFAQKIEGTQFSFALSSEEVMSSIELTLVTDEKECELRAKDLEISVSETYIEVDGQKYFVNMSIPLNFSCDGKDDFWLNFGLAIIGKTTIAAGISAIISAFGVTAFSQAFKHMATDLFKILLVPVKAVLRPMFTFASEFIINLLAGNGAKYSLITAAEGAKDAFKNAFRGISTRTFAYAAGAAIIVIAVWAFFEFILHRSFQRVYVYNLTKYKLQFSFPYKNWGECTNTGGDVINGEELIYIPHVDPELWYNGSGFSFDSNSEWHGLSYVMYLNLLDGEHDDPDSEKVFQSFACVFDVPFSGSNLLGCRVGLPENAETYFDQKENRHAITQYSASNDKFEITVTFDYLKNKHEDPITGKDSYLYNSLVIVREKGKLVD